MLPFSSFHRYAVPPIINGEISYAGSPLCVPKAVLARMYTSFAEAALLLYSATPLLT